MPTHYHQPRSSEMREIERMFRALRRANGKDTTVGIYISGRPGFGKTQLVREYGRLHFQTNKGRLFKKLVVATLNATSQSSFLHSYITLAKELELMDEVRALDNFSGLKGEVHALELLSAAVRKELRKRPNWLLIVDNLSSDVVSINRPHITNNFISTEIHESLKGNLSMVTAMKKPTALTRHASPMPEVGVATAHGISSQKAAWRAFWPQPGDESWGRGQILVTTQDGRLVERLNPAVGRVELNDGMSIEDAVCLLERVSGMQEEGAREVAMAVERVPLSVASAGFYISAERAHNPQYSYQDYLHGLEGGIQSESEQMMLTQNLSYPRTMTMALCMAADHFSSDPNLHKVFVLMAACAQTPVPMRFIARVLGTRPDLNSVELESVRSSALLYTPKSSGLQQREQWRPSGVGGGGDLECVSLYRGTREVFRGLFLGDTVLQTDAATGHVEFVYVNLEDRTDVHVQRRNTYLRQFIDCLVEEYRAASQSDSVSSYRYRLMLLPHLESLLKVALSGSEGVMSGFQLDRERDIELCSTLGSAYELAGIHHAAKDVLERALTLCENENGKNSLQAASIALKLGSSYRLVGMLPESEVVLTQALEIYREVCGEVSEEVADTLTVLSATYNNRGTHNESRKSLEQALEIYRSLHGSKHPSVAVALTSLGQTWRNLGNSRKSRELFEESLAIQEEVFEPQHPSLAVTLRNLSLVFSDLGQPNRSVHLLERALDINTNIYGSEGITVAVTLSNLSVAHRHLGNVQTSHNLASQALEKMEALRGASPDMAVALGVLGTAYSDLGQLDKSRELLQKSVQMNRNFHGSRHIGTAIAQTDLGRVTRLAGDLQEAKTILENALETKEQMQGPNHPSVGVTLISLGKVYHELGCLTDSLLALGRAQEIRERLYDIIPNHPQVAFSQADRAKVLRDCGNLEQSASMMKEAIHRYTSNIDSSSSLGYTNLHPKYSSMMAVMGLILRDSHELEEARRYLEESLAIQEKILSQESLLKAETLCNLGTVLHRMEDREGAFKNLDTALEMIKGVKYSHPITATICAARGRLLLNMGDLNSAQASLQEALTIRTECTGEMHPNVALYHDLMAQILLMNDEMTDAQVHMAKAYKTYRFLYAREAGLSQQAGVELPILATWDRIMQELRLQVDPNLLSE